MAENKTLRGLVKVVKYRSNLNQAEIATKIGVSKQYLSDTINGRYPFSKELRQKLYEQFTYLQEEPIINTTNGVPYYNVDFTLGFDLVENDQTSKPDYLIDFPLYNKCTCWVNAHGDSMHPTISSGDIVALQRLEDFRYLISGEIYAIVTKNGLRTIKRVNDKGTNIQLVPDNKDYDEQLIPKEELISVFSVKGCMKAY